MGPLMIYMALGLVESQPQTRPKQIVQPSTSKQSKNFQMNADFPFWSLQE